jgi:hypothetical protein
VLLAELLLPQPLLGQKRVQPRQIQRTEASQIAVHRVEAGDRSALEVHEQGVLRQALQAEDPLLSQRLCVDQEPHLLRHAVDHLRAALEVSEQGVQPLVQVLLWQERPQRHQPRRAGQRGVRRALPQAARVRAPDALALLLESVPLSPLASQLISAHLLGARRGLVLGCHCKHHNTPAGRFIP